MTPPRLTGQAADPHNPAMVRVNFARITGPVPR